MWGSEMKGWCDWTVNKGCDRYTAGCYHGDGQCHAEDYTSLFSCSLATL